MFVTTGRPPENLSVDDARFFEHEYTYTVSEPGTIKLKHCLIFPDGVVYKWLKPLTESVNPCFEKRAYGLRRLLGAIKSNQVKISLGKDVTLGVGFDGWSKNYFHWMSETLPRLIMIKERHRGTKILLPESVKTHSVEACLQLVGLKEIEWFPERSIIFARDVIVSKYTSVSGRYHPDVISAVRRALLNHLGTKTGHAGLRLYISRAKSRGRRVANENEVASFLRSRGFRVAYMEDLDLVSQLRMMGEVRFLVSAHGAGLTNMLFMRQSGAVLEFRRFEDAHNNCYFSLASTLGHSYYYQFCMTHENSDMPGQVHFNDLHVDMERLRENVEMMLSVST